MSEGPPSGEPDPEATVDDHDRRAIVEQIQGAVAADVVPFEQLDERMAAVYRAATRSELDAVVADLPTPPPPLAEVRHPLPSFGFSLIGDVKLGGWVDVGSELTRVSLLGDITIDLSSAAPTHDVTVTTISLLGDTTVIVADSTRAGLEAVSLLGDERVDLAPARAGSPTVRVRSFSLLGDAKLFSLSRVPEGKLRRLWRALRGG